MSILRKLAGLAGEDKNDISATNKEGQLKVSDEIYCQKQKQKHCKQCGSVIAESDKFCGGCGEKIVKKVIGAKERDNNFNRVVSSQQTFESIPLKYFIFYTYVRIPLSILFGLFYLVYLTYLFSVFDLYLPFYIMSNIINVILCIVLLVGLRLKKLWAWKLNIVVMVLETIVVPIMRFDNFFQIVFIIILISLAWLWPNWIYFRKRKHLFH